MSETLNLSLILMLSFLVASVPLQAQTSPEEGAAPSEQPVIDETERDRSLEGTERMHGTMHGRDGMGGMMGACPMMGGGMGMGMMMLMMVLMSLFWIAAISALFALTVFLIRRSRIPADSHHEAVKSRTTTPPELE